MAQEPFYIEDIYEMLTGQNDPFVALMARTAFASATDTVVELNNEVPADQRQQITVAHVKEFAISFSDDTIGDFVAKLKAEIAKLDVDIKLNAVVRFK